jgi:hypothetical protein
MASWDSARFDFRPDFTLDSKIKEASTIAAKGRYDFDQQKALNRAWSRALDLSNGGRPSEMQFLAAAKDAQLGPEATDAFRKYLAGAYSTGATMAGNAMTMESLGGKPGAIVGPQAMPQVTENGMPAQTPQGAQPAADWLRPPVPVAPQASAMPPVPANEQARTDEENRVVVSAESPAQSRAPMFQLPEPEPSGREYSAPPQEGVFTEYARGLDPAARLAQMGAGAGGAQGGSADAGPILSAQNMTPMERDYQARALARAGVPGATLEEQMGALEQIATKSVRPPVPYNPQAAMVGNQYDAAADAKEQNRAREDMARFAGEKGQAVQKLTEQLLGNFGTVQDTNIARVRVESDLQEKARPREAINQQVATLNRELGTSFDPSKMGDEKTATDVLERVRLQKNLEKRTKEIEVVRDQNGKINGRATLAQIVPLLEGMGKLEGLPGTEGSLQMMIRLLAPDLSLPVMLATGMLDKAGGITDKGFTYFANQLNNIPVEQVRELAHHMVVASPGMAGIYQNFQSERPQALPVVGLDSQRSAQSAPPADLMGSFIRPASPGAASATPPARPDVRQPSKPLPKAGAISSAGKYFDGKNWREPRAGDESKGKIYTGKRWF